MSRVAGVRVTGRWHGVAGLGRIAGHVTRVGGRVAGGRAVVAIRVGAAGVVTSEATRQRPRPAQSVAVRRVRCVSCVHGAHAAVT